MVSARAGYKALVSAQRQGHNVCNRLPGLAHTPARSDWMAPSLRAGDLALNLATEVHCAHLDMQTSSMGSEPFQKRTEPGVNKLKGARGMQL